MSLDRSRRPDLGPEVSVRFPPVHRTTLSNGLLLWTVERHGVPLVALLAIVPAGSSTDPAGRAGLAALTGDMLDEGSGNRDAIGIHEALAQIGAHLEIDTGYDATIVTLTVLSRFAAEGLALLADMVFRPRLAPEDVARVRELRCNRIAQMRDLPAAVAERVFVEQVFPAHPYGHLPFGTEAALRAVTPEDVQAFHESRYALDGTLLIAVGDVGADTLSPLAGQALEGIDRRGPVAFPAVPGGPPAGAGRRLVLVDRENAPQSELRIGHVGVARSCPDYHALVVLNAVLGGQFVSRINLALREDKGYTYGARSGFDWRRAPGPFVVQTSVQTDATADAVALVLADLEQVGTTRPPTDRELSLAKASLTRGYARGFETDEQVARALAQLAVYELPDTWFDEFVPRVRQVTGDEVVAAAREYLRPQDALVTIVGDSARVRDGLAAIGLSCSEVLSAG